MGVTHSETTLNALTDHKNKGNLIVILWLYLSLLLGATLWPFNFLQENRVRPVSGGLSFSDPAMAFTEGPAVGLEKLREFTLVLDLSTDIPGQAAWIFGYGVDFGKLNLLVGLYMNSLIVELHRGGQRMRASIENGLPRGDRAVLVVTGTRTALAVYVNGTLRREVTREAADDTDWNTEYPLVFGARSDGKYPWTGTLYSISLFDSVLDAGWIGSPERIEPDRAFLHYQFSEIEGGSVRNSGTGSTGPILISERFEPLHRSVLMEAPFPIWSDITINIIAFLPIGMMIALIMAGQVKPWQVVVIAGVAAVGLSLTIELMQLYLPRRWSTVTDVWTNTLGGLAGAVLGSTRVGRAAMQRLPGSPGHIEG